MIELIFIIGVLAILAIIPQGLMIPNKKKTKTTKQANSKVPISKVITDTPRTQGEEVIARQKEEKDIDNPDSIGLSDLIGKHYGN